MLSAWTDNTDCDDGEALAYPTNPEVCDGIDNDCAGGVDDGVQNTYYADVDGDLYGNSSVTAMGCSPPVGFVVDNTDCDDGNAVMFPSNPEVCDGLDNNCVAGVDEGVLITFYVDLDTDGFGNATLTTLACLAPAGYVADNTDCDDTEARAFPGNAEVCDGIDNNCVGGADEVEDHYFDADGDGFGNATAVSLTSCAAPVGYVRVSGDCADDDPGVHPGVALDGCDGLDSDCDVAVDEDCALPSVPGTLLGLAPLVVHVDGGTQLRATLLSYERAATTVVVDGLRARNLSWSTTSDGSDELVFVSPALGAPGYKARAVSDKR